MGDVVYLLAILLVSANAWASTFKITPLTSSAPDLSVLEKGVRTLFQGTETCVQMPSLCQNPTVIKKAALSAQKFQHDLAQRVEAQRRISAEIPFTSQQSSNTFETYERTDFQFPSMVQREPEHPSNTVYGVYFTPRPISGCKIKYPTVVIVHSSVDNVDIAEMPLAEVLPSFNQSIAVLMIYLPQYGPRRVWDPNEAHTDKRDDDINFDFLTPDSKELRLNITQAMLDLHAALDWLTQQDTTDKEHIVMLGFSMGAFLENLYEAMDPGRITGGQLPIVGGGDIAGIANHYIHVHPESETARRLRLANWNVAQARLDWADMAPSTWAGTIKHQKFYFINALHDELVDPQLNATKLMDQLSPQNDLKVRWNDAHHDPSDESVFFLASNIFSPIEWYVLEDINLPLYRYQCRGLGWGGLYQ